MATKKSDAAPACTNCGVTGGRLLACSRCKLVQYCGKDCQTQHWGKGEHKLFCVSVDQRKPEQLKLTKTATDGGLEEVTCFMTVTFDLII